MQWPTLQQRRIVDVVNMINLSGFNVSDLRIRIPSEGVTGCMV